MTDGNLLGLLLWGTVAGLDLASVLQGLLNRPLVAGAVAGAILGDPESGLRIGAVLELFALDVLPIGASRYPDYGAATVASVALGAGQDWALALGPSVLLGLLLAQVGGAGIILHRRVTAWTLRRAAPALDQGVPGVAARIHTLGLATDFARSIGLAAFGLLAAALVARAPRLDLPTAQALTVVVISGGFVAVIGGAIRRAGTRRRITWLVGGTLLGLIGVALS
jgi:PTS system mannose-specific IIC component